MRVMFFVLLALNAIYLAWAGWIHAPSVPPVVGDAGPALPQLALVSERAPVDRPRAPSAGGPALQPVAAVVEPPGTGNADSRRCVSVGPFDEIAQAARAAALLSERGFNPRQRAEQGEAWEGYWVYVGDLKSAAEETRLLAALKRAGLGDTHAMPETGEGRRVSVGLFSERDRAEKRAKAVRRLGFDAKVVERKQAGSVYWVDLDLDTRDRAVPTEGLLSAEGGGSRLEIRACPDTTSPTTPAKPAQLPRDARPAATTADAGARPG